MTIAVDLGRKATKQTNKTNATLNANIAYSEIAWNYCMLSQECRCCSAVERMLGVKLSIWFIKRHVRLNPTIC